MIKALVIGYSIRESIKERQNIIQREISLAGIKREDIISVTQSVASYGWHEVVVLYETVGVATK